MKKLFYISALMLAVAATSCNGSGNTSTTSGESTSQVEESIADSVSTDSVSSSNEQVSQDANTQSMLPVSKDIAAKSDKPVEPKVQPKPESETDKLVKQYSDAMVSLIEASKGGKIDEAANKKFLELQSKLEALDKSGKLSETQKELFKVTNDAYNMLKNK